jgi:hypothetical protein
MTNKIFILVVIFHLGITQLFGNVLPADDLSISRRDVPTAAAAYIRVYNKGAYVARFRVTFKINGQEVSHKTGISESIIQEKFASV